MAQYEGSRYWYRAPHSAAITRPRLARGPALLLGAVLFLAILGLEMSLWPIAPRQARTVQHAGAAAVDSRLVIRARTLSVAGDLSNGRHLLGTLYPGIPGANVLRLATGDRRLGAGSRVEVIAEMPGMAMKPIRATLVASGVTYSGAIDLPMFGRYVARIVMSSEGGRAEGIVPLPRL